VQPTTEAVDAAGAVDAQNAPTAPWKSLRDSHKRPQPFSSLDRIKNEMHLALAREEGIREY
jgi:hypothetical protein